MFIAVITGSNSTVCLSSLQSIYLSWVPIVFLKHDRQFRHDVCSNSRRMTSRNTDTHQNVKSMSDRPGWEDTRDVDAKACQNNTHVRAFTLQMEARLLNYFNNLVCCLSSVAFPHF